MTVTDHVLGEARTRAEKVRARRARQRRQVEPLKGAGKLHRPRRRSHPRRRLDLAIPHELGAEIRLPAIPAVHAGPRLLSGLVLVLSVYALMAATRLQMFYVTQADVQGATMLTATQIRSIARVDQASVFLVDPRAGAAQFAKIPEVASANVSVAWPNRVVIHITERKPAISWDDAGRTWWISGEGIAFLQHGDDSQLIKVESDQPVLHITQDPLAKVLPDKILVAASVLAAQLPKGTTLRYDPDHGLGFEDPHGWTAYFGVGGDMVMKVRLYKSLSEELAKQGVRASIVSVKDPATPYYRQ